MFSKQEEIYVTVFGLHSNRQWNFLTLEVIYSTPNRPPSSHFQGSVYIEHFEQEDVALFGCG